MTERAAYPSLRGRTALVTGGASGIGEAVVRAFVRNGARVAVLDVDVDAGRALTADLGDAVAVQAVDLTDVDALRVAVATAEDALGPIRALVNNAANDQRHVIEEISPEEWDASQSVNLRQQFFVAQAVLPGMRAAGGGTVVNMTSTAWRLGFPALIVYNTAKAGVVALTTSLGSAYGADEVRVNAVAPGAVLTERQVRLWDTPGSRAQLVAQQMLHHDLLPDDIADAVLFLSADDSRMITKQVLTVDGGLQ